MVDYKEIRRLADRDIDDKAVFKLAKPLIDGFKAYLTSEDAPEKIPNAVICKAIAHAAAFTLSTSGSLHGLYTADDMKITFLAYFDKMYNHYINSLVDQEYLK